MVPSETARGGDEDDFFEAGSFLSEQEGEDAAGEAAGAGADRSSRRNLSGQFLNMVAVRFYALRVHLTPDDPGTHEEWIMHSDIYNNDGNSPLATTDFDKLAVKDNVRPVIQWYTLPPTAAFYVQTTNKAELCPNVFGGSYGVYTRGEEEDWGWDETLPSCYRHFSQGNNGFHYCDTGIQNGRHYRIYYQIYETYETRETCVPPPPPPPPPGDDDPLPPPPPPPPGGEIP